MSPQLSHDEHEEEKCRFRRLLVFRKVALDAFLFFAANAALRETESFFRFTLCLVLLVRLPKPLSRSCPIPSHPVGEEFPNALSDIQHAWRLPANHRRQCQSSSVHPKLTLPIAQESIGTIDWSQNSVRL
jgi:hypothetical protein